MAAIAGLTAGMIVVLVQESTSGDTFFGFVLSYLEAHWDLAILGLSIPFLIVGASMSINDYHDYEADRINNRRSSVSPKSQIRSKLCSIFISLHDSNWYSSVALSIL